MAKPTVSPILQMIRRIAEDHRMKNLPDQDLVGRVAGGPDDAAFSILLRRHGPMVLDVCRNVAGNDADAEDAFQATFLILAQKARSIRKLTSVSSWLHGVAYRTALKAQAALAKRQKHEQTVVRSAGQEPADDLTWSEIRQIIHTELTAISERYRAPLVLCFLEGKTQDQAANHLGVSKATLKKRLEHGRSLLRTRLVRRGIGPTAVVAASAWPAATATACVSPALVSATVKAATALALGQTTAGLLSANVTYLLHNGLKAMLFTKLKVASALVMAFAVLPALGGWVAYSQSAPGTIAAKDVKVPNGKPAAQLPTPKTMQTNPKQPEPQKTQTISGRVLDLDGKPAAAAKLFLLGTGVQPVDLGNSGADGRFAVTVPVPKKGCGTYLVARADGAGLDFINVPETVPADPVELRLEKDTTIKGRVISTEGKPVVGVKVSVTAIGVYSDNSLDSFLTKWKKPDPRHWPLSGVGMLYTESDSFISTTTDTDGRFAIHGTGGERVVHLRFHGGGIAEVDAFVANREGLDPKPYNQATADARAGMKDDFIHLIPRWLLHGPQLEIVAEAERLIRGVVKDIDTGRPRPGVKVWLSRTGDNLLSAVLTTATDAEGRFEIRGARKAESYEVEVLDDVDEGYMRCQTNAADTPGFGPITIDINVKKGVVVTGRVIDAITKKPLPFQVIVMALTGNEFDKTFPEYNSSAFGGIRGEQTAEDGVFRIVTIPGPVLLMGWPDMSQMPDHTEALKYKPAVPDPSFPQYFKFEEFQQFLGATRMLPLFGNTCKVLVLKPNAGVVTQDLVVEPAAALPVKIQDIEGRPLAGTKVTGIAPDYGSAVRVKTDSCSAYHLAPGKPRLMVFYEPTKNLVGTLVFKGDEKEPVTVKLGQPGKVKGRFVDEEGKPLAKVVVNLDFLYGSAAEIQEEMHRANTIETDADGRFQLENVIPGLKFSLSLIQGKRDLEPVVKMEPRSVEAGAALDLGEVNLKLKAEEKN